MFDRISIVQWRLITLVACLLIWHLASIPAGRLLLPSPLDVIPAFVDEVRSGQLVTATLSSTPSSGIATKVPSRIRAWRVRTTQR